MINAPWYICSSDVYRDLNVKIVVDIFKRMTQNHEWMLQNYHFNISHINNLLILPKFTRYQLFLKSLIYSAIAKILWCA